MVNSLEALVLYSVPLVVLLDLLKAVWHLPIRKACVSALFRRCETDEMYRLSRTLPWGDLSPGLWIMKCIVAEWLVSHVAFVFHGPGRVPSLIPFYLDL